MAVPLAGTLHFALGSDKLRPQQRKPRTIHTHSHTSGSNWAQEEFEMTSQHLPIACQHGQR